MVQKFPTSSSRNFRYSHWSSSLSRARGYTPAAAAQFFYLNLWIHYAHHSTYSRKALQLRRNWHHYCTAQTHENIRSERQASDIFCSTRRSGVSCDSCHLFESSWTLHSSVTCISTKIYETRTDEWHTAWINLCVPFLGVDIEQDFHPVVSSFHQT